MHQQFEKGQLKIWYQQENLLDLEHLLDPPEEHHVPTLQLCLDTLVGGSCRSLILLGGSDHLDHF